MDNIMATNYDLSPDSDTVAPRIADLSYRNYDGPLNSHAVRWWIVSVATFRANVHRKSFGYWIPAIVIVIVYLTLGALFYLSQAFRGQFSASSETNYYSLTLYQCLNGTKLLLFAAALAIGASAIAADNRANALLVYLSKPITRIDYLLGKWMGIFLLLFALALIPALCMYLFFLTAYWSDDFLKQNPTLLWRLLLASCIPAAIHSSLILGISAWSKNPRTAGAVYAALYFILNTFAGIGSAILLARDKQGIHATEAALGSNLSIDGLIGGLTMYIYDIAPQPVVWQFTGGRRLSGRARREGEDEVPPNVANAQRPPLIPILTIAGVLLLLPMVAAGAKVRAVEVITG